MSHTQEQHIEANEFALTLLMPEEKFRELVDGGMKKIGDLAEHFQVSSMAVRHRARMLKYKGHQVGEFRKIKL